MNVFNAIRKWVQACDPSCGQLTETEVIELVKSRWMADDVEKEWKQLFILCKSNPFCVYVTTEEEEILQNNECTKIFTKIRKNIFLMRVKVPQVLPGAYLPTSVFINGLF